MARILVLGGAGFIGLHLARRLAQDGGHALTLVDDLSRGRQDAELAALLAHPGVELVQADLTDPRAVAALPRDVDQVYLLAAVVGVRNTEGAPARVVRVNTLVAIHVLDWLAALPSRPTLFFASTSEVYAGGVALGTVPVPTPEDVPLVIGDIANPRFAYAASKILGEAAVRHYGDAHGIRWVAGRFHNVYGPRMGRDHVIPELALRALGGEDPLSVYGPEQRRAFCHAADAVEAMIRLMEAEDARGVVNIGNDAEETLIGDLAALVLRAAGRPPRIAPRPAPLGSVARRCPSLARLRALTGFSPKVTLEAGVAETVAWYREAHARGTARSGA
jgi:UDP-glucose 4-epimerase/UDP-glucuronate decarboxylase